MNKWKRPNQIGSRKITLGPTEKSVSKRKLSSMPNVAERSKDLRTKRT